jgi:L-fuculose-phosphate aldolase
MTPECQILIGRQIPRLKYIQYGTQKLADAVGAAIRTSDAVLLSNHGAVTVGRDLKQAYHKALALEENAKIFFIYSMLKR